MSRGIGVVVVGDRLTASSGDRTGRLVECDWRPARYDAAIAELRRAFGNVAWITYVPDSRHLEIAQAQLPPVSDADRARILRRDSDRFFVSDGPLLVAGGTGAFAFAIPAHAIRDELAALRTLAPVAAVLPAPLVTSSTAAVDAQVIIPAGNDEALVVRHRGGAIASIERTPKPEPAEPALRELIASADGAAHEPMTPATLARAASRLQRAPLAAQLLDAAGAHRVARSDRMRRLRAAALGGVAALAVAWAAEHRGERRLEALRARSAQLDVRAAAPLASLQRLADAREETRLLATTPGTDLLHVFARLGTLLPDDAWLQRVEGTATQWRLDGTARDASRLIPLLDGDSAFTNVRSAGGGMRFVDALGRREAFAITLQPAGTGATP